VKAFEAKRYVVRYTKDHPWVPEHAGQYEKLGGGGATSDLQEALVVGWTPKSLQRWQHKGLELVPVIIKEV
jgi:hypothetical protein